MHFVVVGCGGVGGYFGGRLAQYNEHVTFIAKGAQLEAMRSSGLKINSIAGDAHVHDLQVLDATTLTKDSLASPADIILLCVKSYQLQTAIEQIKPLISAQTRVIPLLNGVSAIKTMQELGIKLENVSGGLAKIIAEKSADGVICHTGAHPHITLGSLITANQLDEPDGYWQEIKSQESKQLSLLAKSLKLAGISVGVTSDIEQALWRKFIFVGAWGAIAASKNLNLGEIRAQSHVEFLLERIVHEYASIGEKLGINLTQKHIKETLAFIARLPDSSETSMQRDVHANRESEFDILVAYPMALAEKLKLSTPVLSDCYQALKSRLNL